MVKMLGDVVIHMVISSDLFVDLWMIHGHLWCLDGGFINGLR